MTTLQEVTAFIAAEATDEDCHRIFESTKARRKILGQMRSAALVEGAEVRIEGISPKALNGLRGTINTIRGARADIDLDANSTRALSFSGTRHARGIAPGALTHLLVGVPLSTCIQTN
jgi:hypothetical protein